jgi:hypothetical protein
MIITLVFEKKNTNFFAENCRKSQKIITSAPDASTNILTHYIHYV